MSSNGLLSLAGSADLDPGDRLLPVYSYTRSALPPYIYTIDGTGTSLKLYRYDATLVSLGGALPYRPRWCPELPSSGIRAMRLS